MIEINGYKLYGVTKFTKDIKTHNYFDNEVIRISGRDKLVYLVRVPKSRVAKGDLAFPPKFFLDPRNCRRYQDYIFLGREEATYRDVRQNLIDVMINYEDEELTKELKKEVLRYEKY